MEQWSVEHEASAARVAHAAGVPTPAAGDIVQLGNRPGIVYEYVEGPSMLDLLQRNPRNAPAYARMLATLHARLHAVQVAAELYHLRRKLELKIRLAPGLSDEVRAAALAALESMPDGRLLCHGDLHPANILMTADGPVILDWIDASIGNPLADVARTAIIILGDGQSELVDNPLLKRMVKGFHQVYVNTYFRLRPESREEFSRWLPVVAAARLSENIPEVEAWLLATARHLIE
jgi:Ser/Thr protein kinase RdoA (MazF antagonist)